MLIVFIKAIVLKKTIIIRYLKVQNGWVVFNNVNFFRKRNDRFLKQSKNETKKRLTTHNVVTNSDEF